jgi:2-C-methyl-D-erythritol 4-phosphate cytidylyltransferase
MNTYAIIVAGGSGERMGTVIPKQFLELLGKPLLYYSITAFKTAFPDTRIILVVPPGHLTRGHDLARDPAYGGQVNVVTGGQTRFDSVKNGLKQVEKESIVFVHDGVRCLLSPDLIARCYNKAIVEGNAIPAVTATDSIRISNGDDNAPIDRSVVHMVQTPQTFHSELLLNAFKQEYHPSFTDEATVVEKTGVRIHLVEGEMGNIKITRPIDLIVAAELLRRTHISGG